MPCWSEIAGIYRGHVLSDFTAEATRRPLLPTLTAFPYKTHEAKVDISQDSVRRPADTSTTLIRTFTFMASIVTRLGAPTAAALGMGLSASGYFTFANYGTACFGVMPAITPGRDSVRVEAGKAVELWAFFYERAAVSSVP